MPQYSDESSCSESESDCEVDVILKELPKAEVVKKTKRAYTRKKPIDDDSRKMTADKLQKARAAKSVKSNAKKQADQQELAELKELKKLKAEGKLKIKKDKIVKPKKETPAPITQIHHHYHGDEDDKKPRKKKELQEPYIPRVPQMLFA